MDVCASFHTSRNIHARDLVHVLYLVRDLADAVAERPSGEPLEVPRGTRYALGTLDRDEALVCSELV